MGRLIALFWMVTAVCLLPARSAFAQSPSGTLAGTVHNEQQDKLAGAQVRLTSGSAQSPVADTTTNKEGRFEFVGLPAGVYTLQVSSSGLDNEHVSSVEIRAAGTVDLTIVLSPGAAFPQHPPPAPRPFDRSIWWGSRFDNTALHELPTTRRVWSLLENQETSTVTERLDTGGLETGTAPRFSAAGASWTENQYLLNGLDVTDPYVPGRPLADPDLGVLSKVTAVTAAKPAMFAGSGVNLDLNTSRPSGDLHGAVRWFYSGRWLQSDNMDSHLADLGFLGPERLKRLGDVGMQLGGRLPMSRAAWPFLASFSRQQLSKELGGFAVPVEAHVSSAMVEFTPFERGAKRLDLLYSGQHIFASRDEANARTDPSATLRRNDNFRHFQARWSSGWGRSTYLATGLGMSHAILSSGLQPGVSGTSTIDLPLLKRSGPAPLSLSGLRARYTWNGLLHTIQQGPLGSHSLDLGASLNHGRITNRWDSLGGMDQVLVEGQGAQVIRWNTPTQARQHMRDFSLFLHDGWRFLNSLVISWGLRLEDSAGQAAGADGRVHWTTLEPRAGLAIPLSFHGLSLRASWSRFGHLLQGRYLDFGNPAALGGQVFAWQDSNGDDQVQPQESSQLLRVFGGPHSGIDPGLKRPFTDEISVGFDWPLSRYVQGRARIFRRDVLRRVGVTDIAVPLSSYDPTVIFDLGDDDDPEYPRDDKTLILYNRKASTLGQGYLLLTNPPGYGARSKGFEIEIAKPPGGRWGASASFVAMETTAPTNPGNSALENDIGVIESFQTDPNSLLYASGVTYFDRGKFGRLHAYYRAPGAVWLGIVAKYYDGLPFARMLFVTGFNQGPFFVRATPRLNVGGLLRTEFNATADLRVAKEFRASRGTLSISVTVFNFLNSSNNTIEADLSGPTFIRRIPWAIQAPRITQLGLEWNY